MTPSAVVADPVRYGSRTSFEAALAHRVIDDYSHPAYLDGDVVDAPDAHIHSDAHMTAVLGETAYRSTGRPDNNVVFTEDFLDYEYCAGCNGSFELDFSATSLTRGGGIFAVGFDFTHLNEDSIAYHAFLTYVNGTTENIRLPFRTDGFLGLSFDEPLRTLHIGLLNGGATTGGHFQLDNLTIGALDLDPAPVPEPATLLLLGSGAAIAWRMRRRC